MSASNNGRIAAALLLASAACGGDDGSGDEWETASSGTTAVTTSGSGTTSTSTTGGTTDASTTGSASTGDASTGTTGSPPAPDPSFYSIAGGEFGPAGVATGISGRALLLRAVSGLSTVEFSVHGLTASTAYAIDVHRLPCAANEGGGHYALDPAVADGPTNRIESTITTNADGMARGSVTVDHRARGDAWSVVVHDPTDATKIACADLTLDAVDSIDYAGELAPYADAEPVDETIGGDVQVGVMGGMTTVSAQVTGLVETSTYETEVHSLPCDAATAGGEYRRDPTMAAGEPNELWLSLVPDAMGGASDTLMADHAMRTDAQALVIHRTDVEMMRPKVACATLVRASVPDAFTTRGAFATLAAGSERGFEIGGSVDLIRSTFGDTTIELVLTGLTAGAHYPVLVHERPCAGPSAPYEITPGVAEMVQSNELWVIASAEDSGEALAQVAFAHLARAEAMSVVVRDPSDGVPIACADLEHTS